MTIVPFHRMGCSDWFQFISPRCHMELGPHFGRCCYFFKREIDVSAPGFFPTWKEADYIEQPCLSSLLHAVHLLLGLKPLLFGHPRSRDVPLDYERLWLTEFCLHP